MPARRSPTTARWSWPTIRARCSLVDLDAGQTRATRTARGQAHRRGRRGRRRAWRPARLGERPTAVVACFDARSLFVIDLQTMLHAQRGAQPERPVRSRVRRERAARLRRRLPLVGDPRSSTCRALAESEGEVSARVVAHDRRCRACCRSCNEQASRHARGGRAAALVACRLRRRPTPPAPARFDRRTAVAFVCVLARRAGSARPLQRTTSSATSWRMHALVTQSARGEIAAVNLDDASACSTTAATSPATPSCRSARCRSPWWCRRAPRAHLRRRLRQPRHPRVLQHGRAGRHPASEDPTRQIVRSAGRYDPPAPT